MLLEERPDRFGVMSLERVMDPHLRRTCCLVTGFDVLLERRPVVESVFAREHELRVGEGDLLLVRQYRADAGARLGVAGSEGLKQLLRDLLLLCEIRAGWERTTERG